MTEQSQPILAPNPARMVAAIFAAWILTLGVDVFLHAGLLATLYASSSPFLLDAQTAFVRIPIGYASFLILAIGLYWILWRLKISGAIEGFQYGAAIGLVAWGAFALGLFSISTIEWPLAIGWWIGQSFELGLVGAVYGSAAAGASFKRIWSIITITVVACLLLTVLLQSVGWAPPMPGGSS